MHENVTRLTETEVADQLQVPLCVLLHWIEKDFLEAESDAIGHLIWIDDLAAFEERYSSNLETCQSQNAAAAKMRAARESVDDSA